VGGGGGGGWGGGGGGGGGSYAGDFERWVKAGSFTGEPKVMLSKARIWASVSIGAPFLGNMDGRFFIGSFLLEDFLLGPLEICKCPVDEYLSP